MYLKIETESRIARVKGYVKQAIMILHNKARKQAALEPRTRLNHWSLKSRSFLRRKMVM